MVIFGFSQSVVALRDSMVTLKELLIKFLLNGFLSVENSGITSHHVKHRSIVFSNTDLLTL